MQLTLIVTDVSVQPIGSMFKGQAVQVEYREHSYTQLCMEWCGRWLINHCLYYSLYKPSETTGYASQ
jgi:hypothetical protein